MELSRAFMTLGFNLSVVFFFFFKRAHDFYLITSTSISLTHRMCCMNAAEVWMQTKGVKKNRNKPDAGETDECVHSQVSWARCLVATFLVRANEIEKKGVIKILRSWRNILHLWKGHVTLKISERLRTDVRFMKEGK